MPASHLYSSRMLLSLRLGHNNNNHNNYNNNNNNNKPQWYQQWPGSGQHWQYSRSTFDTNVQGAVDFLGKKAVRMGGPGHSPLDVVCRLAAGCVTALLQIGQQGWHIDLVTHTHAPVVGDMVMCVFLHARQIHVRQSL